MKAFILILSLSILISCSENTLSSENIENNESIPQSEIKNNESLGNGEAENDGDAKCDTVKSDDNNATEEKSESEKQAESEDRTENGVQAEDEGNNSESSENRNTSDGIIMIAKVLSVSPEFIEVKVVESEYAFGVYLVITSAETAFISDGTKTISRSDIKPNDTVIITYNGQVMLSYPPKIVAKEINKTAILNSGVSQ